jgi:hypothetical protein
LNFISEQKNVSKCFFSETTWTVETKLPRNDHWKVLYTEICINNNQKYEKLLNIKVFYCNWFTYQ